MQAKQLISILQSVKPTATVLMFSDEEGNALHPCDGYDQDTDGDVVYLVPGYEYLDVD